MWGLEGLSFERVRWTTTGVGWGQSLEAWGLTSSRGQDSGAGVGVVLIHLWPGGGFSLSHSHTLADSIYRQKCLVQLTFLKCIQISCQYLYRISHKIHIASSFENWKIEDPSSSVSQRNGLELHSSYSLHFSFELLRAEMITLKKKTFTLKTKQNPQVLSGLSLAFSPVFVFSSPSFSLFSRKVLEWYPQLSETRLYKCFVQAHELRPSEKRVCSLQFSTFPTTLQPRSTAPHRSA